MMTDTPDERKMKPRTVICAYDVREAERVRRDRGLNRTNTLYASSPDALLGVYNARVIETPRFHSRPDARRIQAHLRENGILGVIDDYDPEYHRRRRPDMVEGLAPVVAETRGAGGEPNPRTVIDGLAPAGTRINTVTCEVITAEIAADPGALQLAKEDLARKIGEPHVLADLDPQHLYVEGEGLDIHHFRDLFPEGSRMLWVGTLRAIPDQTTHIVFRPAPTLAGSSCRVALGWDGRSMERPDPSPSRLRVPIVREEERRNGVARPTGRVEVGEDGTVAEVYAVDREPITVICAADSKDDRGEAERIRRDMGLHRGNSMVITSVETTYGIHTEELYVIETSGFASLADAELIRWHLSLRCLVLTPHPEWKKP